MGWIRWEYGKPTENCSTPLCPPRVAAFSCAFLLKLLLFSLRGVSNFCILSQPVSDTSMALLAVMLR
eukprot:COSAG02_NODE_954_length_15689_cov_14.145927_8_plen_67_part_00